jgi:hypothetical protein
MKHKIIVLLVIICLLLPGVVQGQDATMPDLTGMNVPSAAALLNSNGFLLGSQTNVSWTAESSVPENSISAQSIAPGQSAARGTSVDVVVMRSNNASLVYDDNDITLINRSGSDMDIRGVVFNTVESTTPAAFSASRWNLFPLGPGDCTQLWSIGRTSAKEVEGCASIQWMTTNVPAEHFWTGLNGVTSFNVVQDGVERVVCPAAPSGTQPMTCDFYLSTSNDSEVTEYIYFAYTTEQLIVHNRSTDRWMPLTGVVIVDSARNENFGIAAPEVFLNPPEVIGILDRLAPGQCLLFTTSANQSSTTPEACNVIASRTGLEANLAFWDTEFLIDSVTVDGQYRCPPATAGRLTICVMPR